ncbi:MAG: archease [Gallionella sp.]|nr:archease [Gallionella sp.]
MSATAHWEHFPHQADIGVRGMGATPEQAFEQAALALTAVITDPADVAAKEMLQLSCMAPDAELLLTDWLNSLIFEMVTRNMLFSRFEVHIDGNNLTAQVWGEALEVARHHPAVEIKGATYTSLKVAKQPDGGWVAQCVVDV